MPIVKIGLTYNSIGHNPIIEMHTLHIYKQCLKINNLVHFAGDKFVFQSVAFNVLSALKRAEQSTFNFQVLNCSK